MPPPGRPRRLWHHDIRVRFRGRRVGSAGELDLPGRGRGASGPRCGPGSTRTSRIASAASPSRMAADPEWLALMREWNVRLADAGYAAIAWPAEYGGRGAGLLEQVVLAEEVDRAQAPPTLNPIGITNIAPAILQFGTEEQKRTLLPRMRRGDDIWCQGFSEPDAGSDLASLVDPRRARRRPLRGDRPEGVEHPRPRRRLVRAAGPHRSDGAPPRRHHLPAGRPPRRPASRSDRSSRSPARPSSPSCSSPRSACPVRRPPGRRERRLGGGHDHPRQRAGRGGRPAPRGPAQDPGPARLPRRPRRPTTPPAATLAALHVHGECLKLLADRSISGALHGRPHGPESSLAKLVWSDTEQELTEMTVRLARPGRSQRRAGPGPPGGARLLDRRWHHPGQQEHHRHPRARPAPLLTTGRPPSVQLLDGQRHQRVGQELVGEAGHPRRPCPPGTASRGASEVSACSTFLATSTASMPCFSFWSIVRWKSSKTWPYRSWASGGSSSSSRPERLAALAPDRGRDDPGLDQRHVDAPGPQLVRQRLGHGLDGVLRRGVRAHERRGHPTGDRPDEHDAARCLPDQREGRLGDGHLAEHVDLELIAPLVDGQVLERATPGDAGVVDDAVQPVLADRRRRSPRTRRRSARAGSRRGAPDGGDRTGPGGADRRRPPCARRRTPGRPRRRSSGRRPRRCPVDAPVITMVRPASVLPAPSAMPAPSLRRSRPGGGPSGQSTIPDDEGDVRQGAAGPSPPCSGPRRGVQADLTCTTPQIP